MTTEEKPLPTTKTLAELAKIPDEIARLQLLHKDFEAARLLNTLRIKLEADQAQRKEWAKQFRESLDELKKLKDWTVDQNDAQCLNYLYNMTVELEGEGEAPKKK